MVHTVHDYLLTSLNIKNLFYSVFRTIKLVPPLKRATEDRNEMKIPSIFTIVPRLHEHIC